jgi:hypothetical protein
VTAGVVGRADEWVGVGTGVPFDVALGFGLGLVFAAGAWA